MAYTLKPDMYHLNKRWNQLQLLFQLENREQVYSPPQLTRSNIIEFLKELIFFHYTILQYKLPRQ